MSSKDIVNLVCNRLDKMEEKFDILEDKLEDKVNTINKKFNYVNFVNAIQCIFITITIISLYYMSDKISYLTGYDYTKIHINQSTTNSNSNNSDLNNSSSSKSNSKNNKTDINKKGFINK